MTEIDPRIAYLNAREAYEGARKTAQQHIMLVYGVGQSLYTGLGGFVETTIEDKKSTIHSVWDMSRWPSAEDLRRDFLSPKAALAACHELWAKVLHERQSGCVKPPVKLGDV